MNDQRIDPSREGTPGLEEGERGQGGGGTNSGSFPAALNAKKERPGFPPGEAGAAGRVPESSGGAAGAYMVIPPSMAIACPVMNDASSEAR